MMTRNLTMSRTGPLIAPTSSLPAVAPRRRCTTERTGDDAVIGRAARLVLGAGFGLLAGPVLGAHGGLPVAFCGGLLAMAAFFSIPWSWWHWAHESNVAFAAGVVVALMLELAAFSLMPDVYLKQFGRTGEVVVTRRICHHTKGHCTYLLALATPDGRSISGLMPERETRAAGDRFLATWDSTGVVAPRPADETSSGPFGILLLPGLAGFLTGTVFFSVPGRRRNRLPGRMPGLNPGVHGCVPVFRGWVAASTYWTCLSFSSPRSGGCEPRSSGGEGRCSTRRSVRIFLL